MRGRQGHPPAGFSQIQLSATILTGALVDQLRKHDPNQPTALRAWLTSHGWQLEPEPLCPAHSNSTKD